jgi:MoaA/NifB/PqqE/SkfB family radical SAM enzyme
VTHVAFSLDGATRAAHDHWRGEGSFVRLVRAISICSRAELPFVIKTVIRRDTLPQLEQLALFAARMGASAMTFAHLLPTSVDLEQELALDADDRRSADQEVAMLSRIFKMRINLEVGYYNIDPAAPCSSLAVTSYNVDYRGRLTLCCNLSGYRGALDDSDVVADLNNEPFASALARLRDLAELQISRRREALADFAARNLQPDIILGSPCLFCLKTFRKAPWYTIDTPARSLPIMKSEVP